MATQAKIGLLVPSYFSGGRLTLGISLGGRDNEFESLGVRIKQRVGIFQEGLTLMRKLWSEDNVTFHGRYYHVDNVNMDPKPIQKPTIPVVMGGRADAVLKRSAEVDGWVAGGQGSPEAYAESWKKVRAYAVAAGKDPDALESGRLMYICVGDDREQCRLRIRAYTDAYYGPPVRCGEQLCLRAARGMRRTDSVVRGRRSQDHAPGTDLARRGPDQPHFPGCGPALEMIS